VSDDLDFDNFEHAEDAVGAGSIGASSAAPLPSLDLGPGAYDPAAVPIAAYVADPCRDISLRSSDVRRILRLTPAHFIAHHPRLSEKPEWAIKKATKRMDAGTIVHSLVLGHGSSFIVIDPADYKTKDGKPAKSINAAECQAAIKDAEARGLIVLSPKQSDAVQRTASAIREQIEVDLQRPIADHVVETTLVWEEKTAHGSVLCRARPDLARVDGDALCVEIKGTEIELDDDGVQRALSSNDGAYFIQAAWQLRGLAANYPRMAGRIAHRHYFGELNYPNLVAPVSASILALEQADRRCRRAVEKFAEWRAAGLLNRHTTQLNGWPERIGNMAPWLERDWVTAEEEELGATPKAFV
jgi:hypothetical protein